MSCKKRFLSILLLLQLVIFSGCSGGSYKIINGGIKDCENSMNGNYEKFSGEHFIKVKLQEGQIIDFDFEIESNKGKIFAEVVDSKEKFKANIEKSKVIKIPKSDTYTIRVRGDEHSGGFVLSWNKNIK